MRTYEEVVRRIERERDVPARAESFARFEKALRAYRPQFLPAERVILVAGTNGKGSVAKTLEVLLSANGERVGLYTSPHMIDTVERIRSGGADLSHEEFIQAFSLVESVADEFGLSHFEILTLMMIEMFFGGRVRPVVDRAVIEVGVGGRLDPTRLIPHGVSVITRLGLDHAEILGGTLESIAREKFAVADEANLVVYAGLESAAVGAMAEARARAGGTWCEAEVFPSSVVRGHSPVWSVETPWGRSVLALKGARAVENVSLALCVLRAMGVPVALSALREVAWPCRMEEFFIDGKRVYLSGDHNPQGVSSLREILDHFAYSALHLVVGIGKNKDQRAMLEMFSSIPRAKLYLTVTPFRGASLDGYGEWLSRAEFSDRDPVVVLRRALAVADPRDLVLISGSLYLTGDIRGMILRGEIGNLSVNKTDHVVSSGADLPSRK